MSGFPSFFADHRMNKVGHKNNKLNHKTFKRGFLDSCRGIRDDLVNGKSVKDVLEKDPQLLLLIWMDIKESHWPYTCTSIYVCLLKALHVH